MSDCDGWCSNCICLPAAPPAPRRQSRAAARRAWRQLAIDELADLSDIYEVPDRTRGAG